MHRNLDRRVEALVRVTDRIARAELDGVLTASMADDAAAFDLRRRRHLDPPHVHIGRAAHPPPGRPAAARPLGNTT